MVLGNGIEVFQISDTRLSLSVATYSEMFSYLQYSLRLPPHNPSHSARENPKSQILSQRLISLRLTNHKQIQIFKISNSKRFEFRIWCFDIVWCLRFGAWNFLVQSTRFRLFRFRSPLLTESRLYFFSSPY